MNKPEPDEKKGMLEKHLQTIMISLTTAAIMFSATFTFNTNKDLALLAQQVSSLSTQVALLQSKLDGMQINYITRGEFRDHEDRIRAIERRK